MRFKDAIEAVKALNGRAAALFPYGDGNKDFRYFDLQGYVICYEREQEGSQTFVPTKSVFKIPSKILFSNCWTIAPGRMEERYNSYWIEE